MFKKIELLVEQLRLYVATRGELFRVSVVEKGTRFIAWLLTVLLGLLVALFAVAFVAAAITLLLARVIPMWGACLITAAIFLLVLGLLYAFRRQLVIDPVARKMSDIMYNDNEGEDKL